MITFLVQDRLFVDAVVARSRGFAVFIKYRLHDGITIRHESRLLIDADKDRRDFVTSFVVARLPAVVGILVEDRLVVDPVVGYLGYVPMEIVIPLHISVAIWHFD